MLTTGLLTRWRLYYPPLPTLIRLLALQAICWPATHLTLKILEHEKRPLICWAVIGTTTCVSRSVQIWVTWVGGRGWGSRDERWWFWRRRQCCWTMWDWPERERGEEKRLLEEMERREVGWEEMGLERGRRAVFIPCWDGVLCDGLGGSFKKRVWGMLSYGYDNYWTLAFFDVHGLVRSVTLRITHSLADYHESHVSCNLRGHRKILPPSIPHLAPRSFSIKCVSGTEGSGRS
jgi:hypothetical protein